MMFKCQSVQQRCTQKIRFLSVCPFPAHGCCPDCILWKTPWDGSLGGYLATGGKKDTGLASRMRGEATQETKPLFSFMNYADCENYNTDLKTGMNTNWYLRLGHGNLMTSLLNGDWAWPSLHLAEDQATPWWPLSIAKSNGKLLRWDYSKRYCSINVEDEAW